MEQFKKLLIGIKIILHMNQKTLKINECTIKAYYYLGNNNVIVDSNV
jgi:hypothetical protein